MQIVRIAVISSNDLVRYGLASILENNLSLNLKIRTFISLDMYLSSNDDSQTLIFMDDETLSCNSVADVSHTIKLKGLTRRLILLGSFLSLSYIHKVIDAGVDGFIYKQENLEEMVRLAVQTVLNGHIFLSPKASALPYESKPSELNSNEIEVLTLLAKGHNIQDIAYRLNLVDRSIYRIRTRIRDYLGATNNEQIVDAARRHKLID